MELTGSENQWQVVAWKIFIFLVTILFLLLFFKNLFSNRNADKQLNTAVQFVEERKRKNLGQVTHIVPGFAQNLGLLYIPRMQSTLDYLNKHFYYKIFHYFRGSNYHHQTLLAEPCVSLPDYQATPGFCMIQIGKYCCYTAVEFVVKTKDTKVDILLISLYIKSK
jgi:hypothetical protein